MGTQADLQAQLSTLQMQHLALQADLQALKEKYQRSGNQVVGNNVLEQTKAEKLQQVFSRIAERATAGLSFFEFLRSAHGLLSELLYAKNCYVCLYNEKDQLLDFPYYVDEKDGDTMQCNNVPCRHGLTEFVLRTQRPQLIDAQRFKALQAAGEITEATGDLSFSTWLGVPMHIRGSTGGALVIQSYEKGIQYTPSDADILSFVANHFSSAIERHQALEELRKSEARYRSVIENVGVGVVVVQDGRFVFANPSTLRILGHPLEYLLAEPYTAIIHPDDVAAVVDRHQRRLRNEPVELHYGFRIFTQLGEMRSLELSAVRIDWSGRDATLLFLMDATARLQAEQSQRVSLQKQTELNAMKSRFIAMASHEFRTPLATIHGSVELLLHYKDRLPADKQQLTLQKIGEAVERMTHMLENVLIIGRTDAGQLEFKPKPMAITPFCRGLVDELKSTMLRGISGVQLTTHFPPEHNIYLLDEVLMRNIVGNLLSNALKYSPHGGQVCFSVLEQPEQLTFTVSDQGIGIPEEDLPHLFESFHRASNVGPISGTGLGLAIVKEAVDCHRGRLEVSSQIGQGSCFTVTLPTSALYSNSVSP